MAAAFKPRAVFPPLDSLTKSYFLGHHRAGLTKMNSMLTQIDLIIECRDYRVPLTSRNPLFEHSLAGRERVVVYTKRDLGSRGKPEDLEVGKTHMLSVCAKPHFSDFYVRYREKTSSANGILHPRCSSPTTKSVVMYAKCLNSPKNTPRIVRH